MPFYGCNHSESSPRPALSTVRPSESQTQASLWTTCQSDLNLYWTILVFELHLKAPY